MGHLKLSDHVVQNRHTGEHMMHRDMLKKRKFKFGGFLSLTCPSASFALQYGDFVPRDCSAAKGPLLRCAICLLYTSPSPRDA